MRTLVLPILVASLLVETYQQQAIYPGCWTDWFDRDDPTATGDWETLTNLRDENPGKICDNPLQIEVQTITGGSVASTGDVIAASDTTNGFVCKNSDQRKGRMCRDYKVRFMCPAEFCHPGGCWTDWLDRDNPSGTGDWETLSILVDENPGKICDSPLQIEAQTTAGDSVASTGDVIALLDPSSGFACQNSDQSGSKCHDYTVRFFCPAEFCHPKGCWSDWFDRDNPSGTGDWETLSLLVDENPGKICDSPLQIEAQTTAGDSVASTGDVISISDQNTGFVCENSDQSGSMCHDYQVRFFCPEDFCSPRGCWTEWFDRDDPTATGDWETLTELHNENPGKICDSPLQIEAQTTAGDSVASTGDVISISDPNIGFVCRNSDQSGSMCHDYQVRFFCPEDFCSPKVCWTNWFDRDNPSGVGDWELLSDLRNEYPGQICESPLDIEVQTVDTSAPAASTGQSLFILSPTQAFACRNGDQSDLSCLDYKVRFGCPCL